MGREMELVTRKLTFTAGLLGGRAEVSVLDSDSLLLSLAAIRDCAKEKHTIDNVNKLIIMIHKLNLKH